MVLISMNANRQLPVVFFANEKKKEPVREWLKSLSSEDKQAIGADIQTVEFGWPLGMPLCRSISGQRGLWEVRIDLKAGRIARIFFCIHDGNMVLLHGFEKKSQKTPNREIEIAVKRMKGIQNG